MPALSRKSSIAIPVAAAVISGFAATHSVAETSSCPVELTVAAFGSPACLGRISTPTPRPDEQSAEAEKQDRLQAAEAPVYIDVPTEEGVRKVRLVGTRFLPDDTGKYHLRREVTFSTDPVNAAFFSLASMLMPPKDGAAKVAAAKVSGDKAAGHEKTVLEARANLAEGMAAN